MVTLCPRAVNVFAVVRPATPAPITQTFFCLTMENPPCSNSAKYIAPVVNGGIGVRACLRRQAGTTEEPDLESRTLKRWLLPAENSLHARPRCGRFRGHPTDCEAD